MNKHFNWNLNEFMHFFVMTLLSGGMIGICATSSLIAIATLSENGRFIGAILFSLGLFVILAFEMKLFTGLIPDLPHAKLKNLWKLPVCLVGNLIGVFAVYFLVSQTSYGEMVLNTGATVIRNKLNHDNWAISAVCSGILCGILITISILSVHHSHKKGLSANVGVIFPIIVFAFCGFDHSIANMFYFYCLGEISWQVVGYILLTILGNMIGGVLLPLALKLKDNDPI